MSATLAALYLILFGALAMGFYSSVNSAIAIGDNAAAGSNSRLAAESGMEFIRAQLARVKVRKSADAEQVLSDLQAQLAAAMEATPNLSGRSIARVGGVLQIPASSQQAIVLDVTGARFRVEIERAAGSLDLQVRVYGKTAAGNAARSIRLDLQAQPTDDGFLKYGPAVENDIDALWSSLSGATPDGGVRTD